LELTVRPVAGERLGQVEGRTVDQGVVVERTALVETRDVVVQLEQQSPSRLQRLKDWWNAPVELG
jgi:hypothetical protein